MEVWRDIPGYSGYQVSNLGRVRSLDRVVKTARGERRYKGKMLKPGIASHNYLTVAIGKGNSMSVHVLVAMAFLGPAPFDGAEVRHLDDVRTNNFDFNLAWGSRGDNGRDKKWNKGQRTYKLSPPEVSAIKGALAKPYKGIGRDLADAFGVSQCTISTIRRGLTHTDVR